MATILIALVFLCACVVGVCIRQSRQVQDPFDFDPNDNLFD